MYFTYHNKFYLAPYVYLAPYILLITINLTQYTAFYLAF